MHQRPGNTLIPAVVILAIAAFVAVLAFAMWPKPHEFDVNVPAVKTQNANAAGAANSNTNTTNTNKEVNGNSNTNTAAIISSNIFSYSTVKIGDHVGGMIVASAKPFKSDATNITPNAIVTFSGQVTITGTVTSSFSAFAGSTYVCIGKLDAVSLKLIPKAAEDTRDVNICFTNSDLALKTYPLGTNRVATIVMNSYVINDYPTEVLNMAEFISAVSSTADWKTYTDPTYKYSFKYPSNWTLQVAHANDPKNVFGSEYAYVVDPANPDIIFGVCPTGNGCIVTQDAQVKATTSSIMVDQHPATQSDWTVTPSANCSSCTPATTIQITSLPGWSGTRNFLLRTGNKTSNVPSTILSTFTFTK